ncbi:MAG: acylphosphatase [Pirellulales bacterium]|nr:acylphosphatase [Pirellulales bacterium]
MNATDRQRCVVYYAGRVQGVGFRATVVRVAQGFAVAGFVQNLPDGRVRAVVEGAADEVARFRAALRETMQRYIRDEDARAEPATGEFVDFQVRY